MIFVSWKEGWCKTWIVKSKALQFATVSIFFSPKRILRGNPRKQEMFRKTIELVCWKGTWGKKNCDKKWAIAV